MPNHNLQNMNNMKNYIVIFDYDRSLFDTPSVDMTAVNKTQIFFDLPPLTNEAILKLIGLHTIDIARACLPSTDIHTLSLFIDLFTIFEVKEICKTVNYFRV
jgi:phosphoglycolate phosphatase-like HAD superfamily hydrolase